MVGSGRLERHRAVLLGFLTARLETPTLSATLLFLFSQAFRAKSSRTQILSAFAFILAQNAEQFMSFRDENRASDILG